MSMFSKKEKPEQPAKPATHSCVTKLSFHAHMVYQSVFEYKCAFDMGNIETVDRQAIAHWRNEWINMGVQLDKLEDE